MTPEATTTAPLVHFRPMEAGDVSFVFSSWLKSYAKASGFAGVDRAAFFKAHHATVERLLQRAKVLVVCDPTAPAEVWGWCCYEARPVGGLVHYVYVKQLFRRFGLATQLLAYAAPTAHTHQTEAGKHLAQKLRSTYLPEAAQ